MLADVRLTKPGVNILLVAHVYALALAGVASAALLGVSTAFAHGGDPVPVISTFSSPDTTLFQVGEELTYNVSYSVVDIGQVRVKIVDKVLDNGRAIYKAIAYIDSYKGIPFVDLHTMYESAISESLYSTRFRSRTKIDDGEYRYFVYDFDYPRKSLFIEYGLLNAKTVEGHDTLRIDTLFQDGLSLFYYARSRVRRREKERVPTVVSEQLGSTFVNFKAERQKEEIDAVDYPVDVLYFDGRADFIGIFGLTGEFEGWFSNDEACVPILAKMKVLIGSVRIELMRWKREGWKPPRYTGY